MKGSDFPDKEVLTTADALRFCRFRGWSTSSAALYYQGLRFGFMTKSLDGYHWQFSRAGLSKFLMQKNLQAPPGYLSVAELAKKVNLNLSIVYQRIKDWGVETIKVGPKKTIYVSELSYERRRRVKERIPLDE
ncbi:MAG: hypothetical protein C4K49_10750 [Candidatus Thorarchaeota archaeon]|nr:MAG: hypothetical protein C4K49_10750 [Candidatus Thorarchaeota archaeon]